MNAVPFYLTEPPVTPPAAHPAAHPVAHPVAHPLAHPVAHPLAPPVAPPLQDVAQYPPSHPRELSGVFDMQSFAREVALYFGNRTTINTFLAWLHPVRGSDRITKQGDFYFKGLGCVGISVTRVVSLLFRNRTFANNAEAMGRGALLHWDIELYFNRRAVQDYLGESMPRDPVSLQFFEPMRNLRSRNVDWRQFIRFHTGMVQYGFYLYRAELPIFSEALHIAGTVDAIYKHYDSDFVILVDWKRSRLDHAPDPIICDALQNAGRVQINRYNLQLNLYALILQDDYGMEIDWNNVIRIPCGGMDRVIGGVNVVAFHPESADFVVSVVDKIGTSTLLACIEEAQREEDLRGA